MEHSTLTVRLGPSRGLAGLLVGAHLAAAVIGWVTLPNWWLTWALSMAILVSLVDALRVHALRTSGRAATRVDFETDGKVAVHFRHAPMAAGRLLGSSFVSSGLVILRIGVPGRRMAVSIVIATGSLAGQDFRRLRVWLRWRPIDPHVRKAVQPEARADGDNPSPG